MGLMKPAAAFLVLMLAQSAAANWYWQDAWQTRDQQGAWYFNNAEYAEAARRFEDPFWQATAWYAAQNFAAAARVFSQIETADARFNAGNALAHLKDYQQAAEKYREALAMRPGWEAAQANLSLVEVLGREVEEPDDYDGGSGGKIGADEIVFEQNTARMQQAEEVETLDDTGLLSSESVNQLWMRRLQTTPADFLRVKFLYQSSMQDIHTEREAP